jgi:hypothetical protein
VRIAILEKLRAAGNTPSALFDAATGTDGALTAAKERRADNVSVKSRLLAEGAKLK